MSTLTQLIRKNNQHPVRKCYIKRRDFAGDYEADWVRIDNWTNGDRVINWGNVSLEINHLPAQLNKFQVSNLAMTFDNHEGHFNIETFDNSIWNGFIGRKFTKLKIETAYLDSDKTTEVGTANIFEGIIDRVIIGEDQLAKITILSYQTIISKYDIKDLSFTSAEKTVEQVYESIMNQSKITKFIPYVAATPDLAGIIIDDPSTLTGSYWKVLLTLAEISNSTIALDGSTISFQSRTSTGSSVWDFLGLGATGNPDIFRVSAYDDEGADRVRLRFQEQNGDVVAISDDPILLEKYLGNAADGGEVQFVDLSKVKESKKQEVLDGLVDYWEKNRPTIDFETRFLINQISPLDPITIDYQSGYSPSKNVFRIGVSRLGTIAQGGDGHVLAKRVGAIHINSNDLWLVTKVKKDVQNWKTTIKAEKIFN